MQTKHIFVPVLDIGELLPFAVRETKKLSEQMEEQERAKAELVKFIDLLQKNFGETLWYLGMDVIGEKSYERFMFDKSGFMEVMVEAPIAINAHFPDKKRANLFCTALKTTLKKILPPDVRREMFIDSIEVQDENDESLKVEDWNKIKDIRNK